jgi:hypothetical protein
MALGLTQPLTETSTRNISWGERWPVRRADNLTTFMCRLSWNLGASTWNPQGLCRPVMGLLYLFCKSGNIKNERWKIVFCLWFYWCETWSSTARVKYGLRVVQNGALRGVLGPQREEVTVGWRKLRNEKLLDLCCTPNITGAITWRMRWVRHGARMGTFGGETWRKEHA